MRSYESPALYIDSFTNIQAKITAIDTIITGLMTAAASGASKSNISEYQIDDGQSKIRTAYRSLNDVFEGIKNFEKLRQMYLNQLNGRVIVLKDRSSI